MLHVKKKVFGEYIIDMRVYKVYYLTCVFADIFKNPCALRHLFIMKSLESEK